MGFIIWLKEERMNWRMVKKISVTNISHGVSYLLRERLKTYLSSGYRKASSLFFASFVRAHFLLIMKETPRKL